jgi:hypothetical protein
MGSGFRLSCSRSKRVFALDKLRPKASHEMAIQLLAYGGDEAAAIDFCVAGETLHFVQSSVKSNYSSAPAV